MCTLKLFECAFGVVRFSCNGKGDNVCCVKTCFKKHTLLLLVLDFFTDDGVAEDLLSNYVGCYFRISLVDNKRDIECGYLL